MNKPTSAPGYVPVADFQNRVTGLRARDLDCVTKINTQKSLTQREKVRIDNYRPLMAGAWELGSSSEIIFCKSATLTLPLGIAAGLRGVGYT
jgi:hypothetical protein